MKKNLKGQDFLKYLLENWFVSSIKTSWRFTHNPVVARHAAEDAGKRMFKELFEKPDKWTRKNWAEAVVEYMETLTEVNVEFPETADKPVDMYIKPCMYPQVMKKDRFATCSFCYGTWRTIFREAFPHSDLRLTKLISKGDPFCEFKFLVHPTEKEKMEAIEDLRRIFFT